MVGQLVLVERDFGEPEDRLLDTETVQRDLLLGRRLREADEAAPEGGGERPVEGTEDRRAGQLSATRLRPRRRSGDFQRLVRLSEAVTLSQLVENISWLLTCPVRPHL